MNPKQYLQVAGSIFLASLPCGASSPWTQTGSMTFSGPTNAVLLQDGKVLASGASTIASAIYTPTVGTWSSTGSGSYAASLTLMSDGKVLSTSGGNQTGNYVYSPALGTWSQTGDFQNGNLKGEPVLLGNGKLLVAGGIDYNTFQTIADCELYDPVAGTWSATGSLNTARDGALTVKLDDGKVLIAGNAYGFSYLQDAELYDPATGSWTPTGSMIYGQAVHDLVLLPDGRVLAVGNIQPEIYDPSIESWSLTSRPLSTTDYDSSATLLADGTVLVVESNGGATSAAQIYDPDSDLWWPAGVTNDFRGYGAAVPLGNGKVLLAGGTDFSSSTSSAELYDPAVGTPRLMIEDSGGSPLDRWREGQPDFVSFGSVPIGGSDSLTLTVRNLSPTASATGVNVSVGIFFGYPSGGSFSIIDPPSTTIGPNGTSTFTVQFSPTASGFLYATVLLTHNEHPVEMRLVPYGQGIVASSPYEQAASLAGLTGNDALPGSTPYHDGVPNLLKFAFGLNLAGPDARRMTPAGSVGLPTAYLHENGTTVFRVEYLRRKNSGLTYTPKISTTLANGSFTPLTGTPFVTSVDADWDRVTVDEPFNPATTPKLFTVVEVVLNQP